MSKPLTERQFYILARIAIIFLAAFTGLTVSVYGGGIWEILTTDEFPARQLDTSYRVGAVALASIPLVLITLVWAIIIGASRAMKRLRQGITPRD